MMRDGSVAELAAEMTDPRKSWILLLGTGFARMASVPGIEELARWVLESEEDSGKLVEALRGELRQMSTVERYTLFDAFYRSQSIPGPYWDLARIIRDGQFSLMLTCSVDLLLEEALKAVGLQLGNNNQVFDPLISSETATRPPSEGQLLVVRVHTVLAPDQIEKLLGQAKYTGDEQSPTLVLGYDFESEPVNKLLAQFSGKLWWVASGSKVPDRLKSFGSTRNVRIIPANAAVISNFLGELMAALLSVSPAEAPSVQELQVDALFEVKKPQWSPRTEASKDFEQQGAPQPHDKIASEIRHRQGHKQGKAPPIPPPTSEKTKEPLPPVPIPPDKPPTKPPPAPPTHGPGGPKDALRQKIEIDEEKWPGFPSQNAPFSPDVTFGADLKKLKIVPPPVKDPRAKEIRREESLSHQLRESREILAKLEQQELNQPPWDAQQLRSEIAYQRNLIARLEQEWSRLPSTKRRVEDSLRAIVAAVERAQTKPEVKRFLRCQAATISEEQEREEPNADLIAAAIGGVVLLAGRLGDKVVDPEAVRALASLVPDSPSGRV